MNRKRNGMWVNTVSGQNEHVGKKTVRRGLSEGEGGGEGWASWCVCVCVCVCVCDGGVCVRVCVCVCDDGYSPAKDGIGQKLLNGQRKTGCFSNFHERPLQALMDWTFTRHVQRGDGVFRGDLWEVMSDVENTHMDTKGERQGGMNGQLGLTCIHYYVQKRLPFYTQYTILYMVHSSGNSC